MFYLYFDIAFFCVIKVVASPAPQAFYKMFFPASCN